MAFLQAKPLCVFYGNSSHKIGAGHIMRLFALAQAAKAYFQILFIYKTCPDALLDKLKEEGFSTRILSSPLAFNELSSFSASVIFIDDYDLTSDEWHTLEQLKLFKVKLDDGLDCSKYFVDLVINPAPNANLESYAKRFPSSQFCLGPKYTYLRKEFSICSFKPLNERKNILITLGGTDSKSLAYPLSKSLLSRLPGTTIQLLLGKQHQDQLNLEQLQQQYSNFSLIYNPASVASIMVEAGLAISAAGGTLGELASMGVPTIALITVDNQTPALESPLNNTWYFAIDLRSACTSEVKCKRTFSLLDKVSEEATNLWHDICKRENMSEQARQLIDSKGCQRIIQKLLIGLKTEQEQQ